MITMELASESTCTLTVTMKYRLHALLSLQLYNRDHPDKWWKEFGKP